MAEVTADLSPELMSDAPRPGAEPIPVGTRVEVRSRFVGEWSRGFEVAEHRSNRYGIKRLSDGSILPDDFDETEVRVERRKRDFWWY
ncbi:MAG: hypothetical protein WAM97_16985 [Acidimicrobiales bacterium]